MNMRALAMAIILVVSAVGCAGPNIKLISDASDPLQEFTLEGDAEGKVLVIPIQGVISDRPREGWLRVRPGKVQEVVSHLRLAEKDKDIRAVLLKINSPGGTATASDILYREIMDYKSRTGVKVVASMMDVAASGGYYVALAADTIYAHPTSITGSVGVIFLRPKLTGLMDKIGVGVEVNKSGRHKDMGSPFRPTTREEEQLLQALTEDMADRFYEKVADRRKLGASQMATVKTARIFTATEAKAQGVIDNIGYLSDALKHAKSAAELGDDARVVIYRRTMFPDDNIYNPLSTGVSGQAPVLIDTGIDEWLPEMAPGFYYLWPAAVNFD